MSILNSQAVKFQILSDVASEEDVFDNLIKVKHCLTGEEGLLLCSHYSRWPSDIISQATWLAGCFTPERFAHYDSLVFGNIPKQVINWEINKADKTIVLSIRGTVSDCNEMGIALTSITLPLQYGTKDGWETNPAMEKRVKATKRLLFGSGPINVDAFTALKAISLHMSEQPHYGINSLDYGTKHIVLILELTPNVSESYSIREALEEQAYFHGYSLDYE